MTDRILTFAPPSVNYKLCNSRARRRRTSDSFFVSVRCTFLPDTWYNRHPLKRHAVTATDYIPMAYHFNLDRTR